MVEVTRLLMLVGKHQGLLGHFVDKWWTYLPTDFDGQTFNL